MIALKVRPNLTDLYPPEDIQGARDWYAWCREREVDLRHLNMRFVLDNEDIDVVLTGAASDYEMETNVREATSAIPSDIWVGSPGTGGRPGGPGELSRSQRLTDPPPPRQPPGECGFHGVCRGRFGRRRV